MKTLKEFPNPSVIGQFRSFGSFGPAYEVIEPIKPIEGDDWMMRIRVVSTGEVTDYRYSHLKEDPRAR